MSERDDYTPWYWHLYRPEALLVYVMALLGLYYFFADVSDLRPVRLVPLGDGTALVAGYDAADEGGGVVLWRTGGGPGVDWELGLPGSYVRPESGGVNDQLVKDAGRVYVLLGERSGFGERVNRLAAVDLDEGTLVWENVEQPVGDAEWRSVFGWQGQVVTVHSVERGDSVRQLYVVGRSQQDGSMRWTRVFQRGLSDGLGSSAADHLYLPGHVLVNADSLELLDVATGGTRMSWEGVDPEYVGGWVFFHRGREYRGLSLDNLSDTLLWELPEGEDVFAGRMGFTGFFRGFPVHYGCDMGWLYLEGDSLRRGDLVTACVEGMAPGGAREVPLGTKPRYLRGDWPDFVPVLFAAANPDAFGAGYGDLLGEGSPKGLRLAMLDMAAMRPAWVGKSLEGDGLVGTFMSSREREFLVVRSGRDGRFPVVARFDGTSGQLVKAVEVNLPVGNGWAPAVEQPQGELIWLHNGRHLVGLETDGLSVGFADSDSLQVEEVTGAFREWFGID